jgi:cytochrome c oxidase subunit 1
VVFAMFAGFYFWWPKWTGKMLDERLGKVHFWTMFIGFHTTFLVQHWLGAEGMPAATPLPASERLDHAEHDLHDRLVPAGAVDVPVPVQRLQDQPSPVSGSPWTTRGAGAARWSGRPPARRRGTTSTRCPGSAPSRPAFDLHYPHIKAGAASKGLEQTIPALSAAKK